uniref:G_PROTEIN_RECEP_F1_2 domain-containing protein n=1 Tax=Parastrongyloides trichosuri TaxID=131310 RepID=A0A0N4ZDV5_PARTI
MMHQTPFYNVCLKPEQQTVAGSYLELHLQRYLFPLLSFCGILGNCLNLTVLFSKTSSSRSNMFLSTMALSDIIFLIFILPFSLINYPIFTYNYYFRLFYFYSKLHLRGICNWCSAVTIWCVIAVCTDRLLGIRRPLMARMSYKKSIIINLFIIFTTGALTFYQHFEYYCPIREYCRNTQVLSMCKNVNTRGPWFRNATNPYSPWFITFIDYSIYTNVFVIVILPIFILVILNVYLLYTLKERTNNWKMLNDKLNFGSEKNSNDLLKLHRTENRVTITVALIVTTFTITNGPSAIMTLLKSVSNMSHRNRTFVLFDLLTNALVICGKTCNFLLFCLSSKHFRKRLLGIFLKKVRLRGDNVSIHLLESKFEISKALQFNRLHKLMNNKNSDDDDKCVVKTKNGNRGRKSII